MDSPSRISVDPIEAIRAVEAGSQRFESPCGTGRMVWRKWGSGSPVLLLHGGSGSWMHWLRTIPALATRHTVWVPDLPGFGESDMPPEPVSAEIYAGLIEEGLRLLGCESEGLDAAGFSMGAVIAASLAHRMRGRVRNLVLSGANFAGDIPGRRRDVVSARRIQHEAERRRAFRHNVQVMMIAHPRNIDELALHLYMLDSMRRRLPPVRFGRSEVIRTHLPLVHVRGRVAAISGRDDQVIGHGSDRQAQALASLRPDAKYHTIEEAGHWVMYEGADRYNQTLLGVLEDAA